MRLQSPMLEPRAREMLFMIINNIIPTQDRLFNKFHMVPDSPCVHCRVLHNNVHLFCECQLVREPWFWIRQRLLDMFPAANANTSNFEFLHLMFDSYFLDNEVIWILGVWVQLVWKTVICKKKSLRIETVKSEMSLKFASHQNSRLPTLAYIVGIRG